MKLLDLLKHLAAHQCVLLREGANHSIYINLDNSQQTVTPRRATGRLVITPDGPFASSWAFSSMR